jgi:aminoglycoside phosphotransferase (APT) family kinase protein
VDCTDPAEFIDVEHAARQLAHDFPAIAIATIRKLGEGLGNVAFEVNGTWVFRFPKTRGTREELQREVPILLAVKHLTAVPIPEPIYLGPDGAYVGYQKVPGEPVMGHRSEIKDWRSFAHDMGRFLAQIHGMSEDVLGRLQVPTDTEPWESLIAEVRQDVEHARSIIPATYSAAIDRFLESAPPTSPCTPVFCHNDLGAEHILVDHGAISGVIDWGDTARTDPARDFGLLYRDLGPEVLAEAVSAYSSRGRIAEGELIERAMFYGKCRVFENIAYGITVGQREYTDEGLASLQWMF